MSSEGSTGAYQPDSSLGFRCLGCGHVANSHLAPDRCSMCSGTAWLIQRDTSSGGPIGNGGADSGSAGPEQ